tara:strand:- start:579 stop:806 length:228 start_codon:yes stop_codon:yes gene_type:complete
MTLKKEVVGKLATLMTAAFGFIAAFAWNEAVKSLFAEGGPFFLFAKYGVWIYAVAVTILAVVVTIWIAKVAERMR